jgi:hypothetical protein
MNQLFLPFFSHRSFWVVTLACFLVLSIWTDVISAQPTQFTFTLKIIRDFGPKEQMRKKMGTNDVLQVAEDGQNAYILRKTPISNESDLIRAMGTDERSLSDSQKGLLEAYRFSQTQVIRDLRRYHPSELSGIDVVLIDTNGFEDPTKYPTTRKEFWPKNTKLIGSRSTQSTIQLSGVSSLGYGPETIEDMKVTWAHEYGHSLDRTRIEDDGYGPDDSHYKNEVIAERAAFAEGFAGFFESFLFPSARNRIRRSVERIRYEKTAGDYVTHSARSEEVKGLDFLRVEGVNAMLLYRISQEIDSGFDKVFAAFSKSNAWNNTMQKFLKTFAELHPADVSILAKILDEETHNKLSEQEIRQILGNGPGIERYLRQRGHGSSPTSPETTRPVTTRPTNSGRRPMYKWVDSSGSLHFSDSPPPAGVKYEIKASEKIKLANPGQNPFSDE